MIIKIEENIKSFSSWTNMVKANAEKITEFGRVELEILLANQRIEALINAKNDLQKDYVALQDKESDLIKELNDKYGAGTVDIASGEFIPAN